MCLIIIAHRMSPEYPLVLAANRDEFFNRPTRQAHTWPDGNMIAGRDLKAGGAWLGVGLDGRFAAVTNVRESDRNGADGLSRGDLPLDFLSGQQPPAEYLNERSSRFDEYAGFNLVVGDLNSVYYASNREPGIHEMHAEIIGLSNGIPGSEWPKVTRGREKVAQLLEQDTPLEQRCADRTNARSEYGPRHPNCRKPEFPMSRKASYPRCLSPHCPVATAPAASAPSSARTMACAGSPNRISTRKAWSPNAISSTFPLRNGPFQGSRKASARIPFDWLMRFS